MAKKCETFRAMVFSYCAGLLKANKQRLFEVHILNCGCCWDDVQKVDKSLKQFRKDGLVSQDIISRLPRIPDKVSSH